MLNTIVQCVADHYLPNGECPVNGRFILYDYHIMIYYLTENFCERYFSWFEFESYES